MAMAGLDQLLNTLDPGEYRRGRQFERIVQWFLTNAPEYRGNLDRVWLWDDWPDRPSKDLGIDLVAKQRDGGLWAIQAKAYQADNSVTKRDIDSFLSASASRRFVYRLLWPRQIGSERTRARRSKSRPSRLACCCVRISPLRT
jgi:predicted helicase